MMQSLQKTAPTTQNSAPTFIVGAPRSGTSILYRTLQLHTSFKPDHCTHASGVELTETNIFKAPFSLYDDANRDTKAYMLNDQASHRQFLDSVQAIQKRHTLIPGRSLLYKAIPKIGLLSPAMRVSIWRAAHNDQLIRNYLYYAQQARGTKRILEKTPQHIALLPEIKATFPDAKLLYMPRHPVDVYSSYQRRLQDSIKLEASAAEIKWLKLSPTAFCKKYAASTQLALRESNRNPKQFLIVRYEDFTKDTKTSLQEILTFLDEPYESQCIPQDKPQKSGWQADPHLFGGIKKQTKSWRDYVSEAEAQFIEKRLKPFMEELGYTRYT
ncbi:sulfotransferase family protein [Vacuolonema iberomarrocanum]|uniref:sulfotransferase family protein n=1 Tax=Vacuolonema iberomarrocanum TaxID=3454632 RepID=UPI0019DAB4BC|nr:sulfotransferase [filamentous cyanobacterium LEGE 07170]